MENRNFYKTYIPALEKALLNDNINDGFNVWGPDFYLGDDLEEVESYIERRNGDYVDFIDMVGYYFDAKSHNFPNIQGINIDIYKDNIIHIISDIKLQYNL